MPTWRAIAVAVRALSPVIIATWMPESTERGDGGSGVLLDGVGDGDHAAGLPVDRDEHRRAARFGESVDLGVQVGGVDRRRRRGVDGCR